MEGYEIKLESLIKAAEKITKESDQKSKEEIKEEKMEEFRKIVEGVAHKYAYTNDSIDYEDLRQELWVKVLEVIQNFGGDDHIEEIDGKLIARSCYNRAVDYYRYSRRRWDSTRRMLEDWEIDPDTSDQEKGSSKGYSSEEDGTSERYYNNKFKTGYEEVITKEIINLFPEGSKERKYIVTKLYIEGLISEEDGLPDKLELPVDNSEIEILHLIGYKGKTISGGWLGKRWKMYLKIKKYFGDDIENKEESDS